MKLISILMPSLITIATVGLPAPEAIGATLESTLQVNQTSDPDQLQRILFGDAPPIDVALSVMPPDFRNYGEFQNGGFLGIDRGLVISTGEVKPIAAQNCAVGGTPDLPCNPLKQNPGADLNFDFSQNSPTSSFSNPPRDQTVLDIWFNADRAGTLNFNYVFGSEEFPEYRVGQSSGNDIFYMMLADGNGNLLFDQSLLVADIVAADAYIRNPIGSTTMALDGYTRPFNAQMRFNNGLNRLILGIDDGGDDAYDSAVFFQQISVQMDTAESIPTPSLLLGFTWMGWRRWRDRRKSH
jgi:hypothetical protein